MLIHSLIRQEIRTHSSPINTFTHDRILINTLASRHTSYRFVDGKSEEMYYAYVNSKIQKNDRSSMNFVKTCNIYQSPKWITFFTIPLSRHHILVQPIPRFDGSPIVYDHNNSFQTILLFLSISKHVVDCGKREETGRVAARWAVGAVVRAVRGQHQRKETVRTYSGWFGSTSRGAEQRSRSTRAVCAAAVTRGILSRVSGLADVVARECIVENRLLRSVRNGVERNNVRQKKGYKGACFRCSERATERGLRRTIQRSSRSRRSVRHASRNPPLSTILPKRTYRTLEIVLRDRHSSSLCCVQVSTSFLEDSEDVSSLSEVKSVAKVGGKSS